MAIALIPQMCPGCEHCEGSGECLCDELDPDGLWFKSAPCAECSGSGKASCAADGCARLATRIVRIGHHEVASCDDVACTTHAIDACMKKALQ